MAVDPDKLNAFLGKFVTDFGAAFNAGMVVIGEDLGLYKALAGGAMTSKELAAKTATDERYVREWLSSQAAGGYVDYNPLTRTFSLSPEQSFTLAEEGSPAYLPGAFQVALAALKAVPRITEAFRTGAGFAWGDHDPGLFHGTEKFFRPGYVANLTTHWIPALDGVKARLEAGAKVADVGCGHGASTILMAQAYPKSTFSGFDFHPPSIEHARKAARAAGLSESRVRFEVAPAKSYPGKDYDFVAVFDCLHDMGDPAGASRHVRESLRDRRHVDDRRAVRARRSRAEPESRGPRLLRRLHAHLHTGFARAGRRLLPRRPGGGAAPARSRNLWWLLAFPPCHRNPVQPDLRGASLTRPRKE